MIKLSQKMTCYNCKAFNTHHIFCYLGYKFDNNNLKPLEPCPKPKNILEYIECEKWYRKI